MRTAMRSRSRLRRAVGVLGVGAALFAVAGCEAKQGRSDLVNGKKLFQQKCGNCHVLARADTKGTVGPNLDEAFQADLKAGFPRSTIRGVVEEQILYPSRTGTMPSGIVKGRDAQDVAAYVAAVAARPGKDTGALVLGPTSGPGALFVQQGCGSCHALADAKTSGTTGPDLDKVLNGQSPDQIRESIIKPNAEIASGFPAGVMPQDYGQKMTKKQLDELVEYLAKVTK